MRPCITGWRHGQRTLWLAAFLTAAAGCGTTDCDDKHCGDTCGINYGEQQTWCDANHNCVHAGGSDSGPPAGFCPAVDGGVAR